MNKKTCKHKVQFQKMEIWYFVEIGFDFFENEIFTSRMIKNLRTKYREVGVQKLASAKPAYICLSSWC